MHLGPSAPAKIALMVEATSHHWNPELYQASHSCIWEYGRDLLHLLASKPGERILDMGCGTGQLTQEIAALGAEVIGIDPSLEMIAAARKNFPHLRFEICAVEAMNLGNEFDAVFSNAVLHWVNNQEGAIASIAKALKPGGRFVFEMGGHGNLEQVLTPVYQALREIGIKDPDRRCPWTFPSIGEYAPLLEAHGLRVEIALLFDRPTPLQSGIKGLANWLTMFGEFALKPLAPEERKRVVHRVEELARPRLFDGNRWIADYKRLRMVSVKA